MAAKEVFVVPVIDLANFPAELQKLATASTKLGCFRIINHGMPVALMTSMKEAVRSLFMISDETKLRNVNQNLEDAGYRPPTFYPDQTIYESFSVHDAASPPDVHSFCSALDVSPQKREIITEYFVKLHQIITEVASKLVESLGLIGHTFEEWSCHARLISYKFTFQEDIGCLGVPAHTDTSFVTVLQDDDCVAGLQMIDSNGNSIDIEPLPGTLFINIGDIGKVWSNGRLQNPIHKVICKKATPRISITLLLLAPKDGCIETEAAFIDADHPKLYRKFSYNEYRLKRTESDLKAGEVLRFFEARHEAI